MPKQKKKKRTKHFQTQFNANIVFLRIQRTILGVRAGAATEWRELGERTEFVVANILFFFTSSLNVAINYRRYAPYTPLNNGQVLCIMTMTVVDVACLFSTHTENDKRQTKRKKKLRILHFERNWLNSCGFMQMLFMCDGLLIWNSSGKCEAVRDIVIISLVHLRAMRSKTKRILFRSWAVLWCERYWFEHINIPFRIIIIFPIHVFAAARSNWIDIKYDVYCRYVYICKGNLSPSMCGSDYGWTMNGEELI